MPNSSVASTRPGLIGSPLPSWPMPSGRRKQKRYHVNFKFDVVADLDAGSSFCASNVADWFEDYLDE